MASGKIIDTFSSSTPTDNPTIFQPGKLVKVYSISSLEPTVNEIAPVPTSLMPSENDIS